MFNKEIFLKVKWLEISLWKPIGDESIGNLLNDNSLLNDKQKNAFDLLKKDDTALKSTFFTMLIDDDKNSWEEIIWIMINLLSKIQEVWKAKEIITYEEKDNMYLFNIYLSDKEYIYNQLSYKKNILDDIFNKLDTTLSIEEKYLSFFISNYINTYNKAIDWDERFQKQLDNINFYIKDLFFSMFYDKIEKNILELEHNEKNKEILEKSIKKISECFVEKTIIKEPN